MIQMHLARAEPIKPGIIPGDDSCVAKWVIWEEMHNEKGFGDKTTARPVAVVRVFITGHSEINIMAHGDVRECMEAAAGCIEKVRGRL